MSNAALPANEIEPAGQAHGSVIWLHGLGASGHDFDDVVPLLEAPHLRFVFPHAPVRPVTINGGMVMPAWYDIRQLGREGGESLEQVRESAEQVRALLAREAERGVEAGNVVLAGFSQGGAMSHFVGARHPEALRGILVLSGYEVGTHTLEAERSGANRNTPLLACHGSFDDVVPIERGRLAYERQVSPGRDTRWLEYPIGHSMCLEQIEAIRDWLAALFPLEAGS